MKENELIENGYKLVRKSTTNTRTAKKYTGKYGTGYTMLIPAYDSSQYCYVQYWIK